MQKKDSQIQGLEIAIKNMQLAEKSNGEKIDYVQKQLSNQQQFIEGNITTKFHHTEELLVLRQRFTEQAFTDQQMLNFKNRIRSLEAKLEETLLISTQRAEEIKSLLLTIENLENTIVEKNLEIKQLEHSVDTLVQEKKTLKIELRFAIEARDSNADKIRELKIEMAEFDAKKEELTKQNTALREKITFLEIEKLRFIKDVTGMKLQLEEQQERNSQLVKKMQEEQLVLKFSSQSLK